MIIIFIILLIITLLILASLNKILEAIKLYGDLEKNFTNIYVYLRKRKEYLLENYNDLELSFFYEENDKENLKDRLIKELELPSFDDESDNLRSKTIESINKYNDSLIKYKDYALKHSLIIKFLAYKDYPDLNDLDI